MFSRFRPGDWHQQNLSKTNYQQGPKFLPNPGARGPRPQNRFREQSQSRLPLFLQQRFVRSSKEMEVKNEEVEEIQESKEKFKVDDTKVSATTKALKQLEVGLERKKHKWSKTGKISNKLKRQKMNEKLVKLLTPKNALILLHEIKPGCTYIIKETPSQGNTVCSGFAVQVKHGKDILGTGQGSSKSQAKNLAAENAIKTLFSKAVKRTSEDNHTEDEEDLTVFPWAGLAQFAMYKMFHEWHLQNPELPTYDIQKFLNINKTPKATPNVPQAKKEVPPDAHNLHPTAVLNNIHPGLKCVELERTIGPPSRVKMAFELEGKQYCGISTNKKEAKKEAAKLLLSSVYGVKYES